MESLFHPLLWEDKRMVVEAVIGKELRGKVDD